jgi:hypothetical protein
MVSFKLWPRRTASNDFRSLDEKALVRRLDIFLMTFGCLSQGALGARPLNCKKKKKKKRQS